jgi:hypothetical protein
MEGQLLLAQIAQKYVITLTQDDMELEQTITLRAKGGLQVRLEKR